MRVMWICNIPVMRKKGTEESRAFGGWMTSLAKLLREHSDIELTICYPQSEVQHFEREKHNGIGFYGFYVQKRTHYDKNVYFILKEIEEKISPDIIHIFGTEFPHSFSAMKLNPYKTLISIQGLMSIYAKHYFIGVPAALVSPVPPIFSGRIFNPIYGDMMALKKRGQYEKATIKRARYITGRTEWDYVCVKNINSKVKYFKCNEVLRESFYNHEWQYEKCEKHSILISQSDYPVKGFHIFLRALIILQKKYSDIQVIVTGAPLQMARSGSGTYADYIKKCLDFYHLGKIIKFTGIQDEYQMCQRYLKANVFVMPSLIENSPNSLGEAMIMGTPCVAANVGGINSLLEHGREGLLYQVDAEYMMAYYIERIFEDQVLAKQLSYNAKNRAKRTHDRDRNVKELLKVYSEIAKTVDG